MAIENYSDLKAAIANWTARAANTAFALRIPEFIALAETRIFYGQDMPFETQPVRVRDMETVADVTVTAGTGALPSLFLEFKRLYWSHNPTYRLEYVAPRQFYDLENNASGLPWKYTIEGASVLTKPPSDGVLKSTYWQRYAALTADADTNWILQNAPVIYLQASLIEAWGYIRNADAQQAALASYKAAADAMTNQAKRARSSGETLRMKPNMWR